MKRILKAILCGITVVSLLSLFAFAADNTAYADNLKNLGLFKGTTTGYQLDRAPTRAESAAMLVRLLGKENEAMSKNYSHPFTDVDAWASPYVGYMYQTKLTNGVGNNKFGSALSCSEQMYCTFALRALGYTDETNGDFNYADAVSFAAEKGLPSMQNGGSFLRGDVVLISYQALATQTKAGGSTLLSKLISEGAVSQASANSFLTSLTAYNNYISSMKKFGDAAKNGIAYTSETSLTASAADLAKNITVSMTSSSQYLPGSGNTKIAVQNTTKNSLSADSSSQQFFVKDGYVYVNQNGTAAKLSVSDAQSEIQSITSDILSICAPTEGFYKFNSVSASSEKIILDYNVKSANSEFKNSLSTLFAANSISDVNLTKLTETIILGSSGLPESQKAQASFTMKIKLDNGNTVNLSCSMNINMSLSSAGTGVSVQYPDLSAF